MRGRAGAVLAALWLAGWAGGLAAAQDAAPLIDLGPALTPPGAAPPAADPAPTTAPSTAPAPAPLPDAAAGLPPALPLAPPGQVQVQRDGAGVAPARAAPDILLPLVAPGPYRPAVRLVGERAALTLTLDLPPGVAAGPLRLWWQSTVNILPERSAWRLVVNDGPPVALPPPPVDGPAPLTLDALPLVPGRNSLRIEADQHHRIFCGPDATFDVWTEVDLTRSGLSVAPGAVGADAAGFAAALAAQAARDGRIALHVGPGVPDAAATLAAGRLAAATGLGPGAVTLAPPPLVAPAQPDLARVTLVAGDAPDAGILRGGDGAVVLRVAVPPAGLPDFADLLPQHPAAPGATVATLTPGTPTPLSDLGLADTADYNRFTAHDIRFRLPDDWLILASQDARLDLIYAFADGLPRGALMLVKVNGTTVRLLPLDRGGGRVQPLLDVGFKARLLRPGVNVLRFEAIVPGDPPDLPCVVRDAPLLQLSAASRLTVPASPRMRFLSLATSLQAIGGTAVEGVSGSDTPAVAADALLPFRVMAGPGTARLTVAGLADAGLVPTGDLGLTRRDLEAVVFGAAQVAPGAAADGLLPPEDPPLIDISVVTDGAAAVWRFVLGIAMPGDPPLRTWLAGRQAAALLMMPFADRPGDLWLLLGPDADPAAVAQALVAARDSEAAPRGRVAVLAADGSWTGWQPAQGPPLLLEPLGWGNLRAVLGNYASWSPVLFVATLLALALTSAGVAMMFAVRTRGRRKQ